MERGLSPWAQSIHSASTLPPDSATDLRARAMGPCASSSRYVAGPKGGSTQMPGGDTWRETPEGQTPGESRATCASNML
eukprot:15454555-Alexandrium_andersonii.AAC.1